MEDKKINVQYEDKPALPLGEYSPVIYGQSLLDTLKILDKPKVVPIVWFDEFNGPLNSYGKSNTKKFIDPQRYVNETIYNDWVKVDVFKKNDEDKDQWHLVPDAVMKDVVEILTRGEKKYPGENWKKCTDKNRYLDAIYRHLYEWKEEDREDGESGYSHLAHAICNLLFLAALEKEGKI